MWFFHIGQKIEKENWEQIKSGFDAVILATGSGLENVEELGLKSAKTGLWADNNTFATDQTGIFAAGSAIRTQKMAVKAVAMGKETAWSVDEFLRNGEGKATKRAFNSRFGTLRKEELSEYLKESVSGDRVEAKSEKGFTKEEAMQEAARCLHCDCRKLGQL